MNLYKKISTILNESPKVCITLGSGLHTFIEKLTNKKTLPYSKIDNFHKTNVKGHKGEFVFGKKTSIKNISKKLATIQNMPKKDLDNYKKKLPLEYDPTLGFKI